MKAGDYFSNLCRPAYVYLVINVMVFISLAVQNLGNTQHITIGQHTIPVPHHSFLYFVFKALFILFWTYILDSMCKAGYTGLSWFVLLLPFIFMVFAIGLIISTVSKEKNVREGLPVPCNVQLECPLTGGTNNADCTPEALQRCLNSQGMQ